jgi:hypothetical protein
MVNVGVAGAPNMFGKENIRRCLSILSAAAMWHSQHPTANYNETRKIILQI